MKISRKISTGYLTIRRNSVKAEKDKGSLGMQTYYGIDRRAGMKRELMGNVRRKQLQILGHMQGARGLERDCRLGKINGKRELKEVNG